MYWGMPKTKKVIDNRWIADGLYAYQLSQADLARRAKIDPDKLNKSIKNTRGVTAEEYQRIMEVFKAKKSENDGMVNDSSTVVTETMPAPAHKEGNMGQDGLLAIVGDLVSRVSRLEREIEESKQAEETKPRPSKARKA